MNIQRTLAQTTLHSASNYPVVTLVGPRQVGKTTLVRSLFSDKPYINLEAPDVRTFALTDPKRFIAQYLNGAVIDEIQYAPDLLSYIQVIVDEKKSAQFILTGSQQLDLHSAVSQSLAGRTAIISMLPLSIVELEKERITLSTDEYLLNGFMPAIYSKEINPQEYYRNYVLTYLERDLRNVTKVHDLNLFQKFLRLCAGRVGCVLNQSGLANEVGVSNTTIQQWLSILEASYLIFRLQPFYENLGKRVIKSPKLYFFDVGLVSYLLGIETTIQLARDPLRGQLFENLVVLECIKSRINHGHDPNLFYFRDSHQNEVDLLYKKGSELIPIEIKSAESISPHFVKSLKYIQALAPKQISSGYIIYAGDFEYRLHDFELYNYKHIAKLPFWT